MVYATQRLAYVQIDPTASMYKSWKRARLPTVMQFLYVTSEEFSDPVSQSWEDETLDMSPQTVMQWTHTAARTLSIELQFTAQGVLGNTREEQLINEVQSKANWFRALGYPTRKKSGGYYRPPKVYLTIGRLFSNTPMRGYIKDPSITWKGPFDITIQQVGTYLAYNASVSFQFVSSPEPEMSTSSNANLLPDSISVAQGKYR